MSYFIEAACGCNIGNIRKRNEDNFYFEKKHLEKGNKGLKAPVVVRKNIYNGLFFSVFDGMGGESFGAEASFAAAREMSEMGEITPETESIRAAINRLNAAVERERQSLMVTRMGTTMAGVCFSSRHIFICNVGDSRIYRLRNKEFSQLSVDHSAQVRENSTGKAPLIQYLGIDTSELMLEPFIEKQKIKSGDIYLLCTDGLTDMASDEEICNILVNNSSAGVSVSKLIALATEHGGRDNITVIICRVV